MSHEFYKKHRPTKLSQMFGQEKAISTLRRFLKAGKVPHSILFNGPTGTGKTTLMRIMKRALQCSDSDYVEINTADFKGVDTIREIRHSLHLQPLGGAVRVIAVDECHKLTNDAQNAILKMLEDTPDHVYFLLGTTDPHKLLAPVLGRCSEIKLQPLSEEDLEKLIRDVMTKENLEMDSKIVEEIASAAGGSARKALVILDAVSKAEGDENQKMAIQITTINKDAAFKLGASLIWPRGSKWDPVALLLQELKDQEPEGVRYLVLAMARNALIGKDGKPPVMKIAVRAARIIDCFEGNFYDSKQAGLAFACWRAMYAE